MNCEFHHSVTYAKQNNQVFREKTKIKSKIPEEVVQT